MNVCFHPGWVMNVSVAFEAFLHSCLCLHGSFSVLSVMCAAHSAGSVRGQADTVCSLLPLDRGLLITRLMKAKWIQLLSQITGWFSCPHWSLADAVILPSATNSPLCRLLSRSTNWIDLIKWVLKFTGAWSKFCDRWINCSAGWYCC